MIEVRKKTDQFEAGISTTDPQELGIESEGVIAYQVQTRNPTVQEREGFKKPLYLLTLTALQPGQSTELDNNVILKVDHVDVEGFDINLSTLQVTVSSVIGMNSLTARGAIQAAGLVPNFVGPVVKSEVGDQSPTGGDVVPKGNVITLHMFRTDL